MKNIMSLAVFAAALLMVFAGISSTTVVAVPVDSYQGVDTTTGNGGLTGVAATLDELVSSIDSVFGIVTGSDNLNALLRNLSAALAVWVQHSLNELVGAFNFSLQVGLIGCLFCGVGSLASIPAFVIIGTIGLTRAFIDALAQFTSPTYYYGW